MAQIGVVSTYREVPAELLGLLTAHMPYSLPLLHRLQLTRVPGGITEHARVLLVADRPIPPAQQQQQQSALLAAAATEGAGAGGGDDDMAFTAAYVDLSRNPETQVWLYSSVERAAATGGWATAAQARVAGDQGLAVLRAMKVVRDEYEAGLALSRPPAEGEDDDEESRKRRNRFGMIGSLSSTVRAILTTRGCGFPYCTPWDMWVFQVDRLPDVDVQAEMESRGLQWGKARMEDYSLVISRTKIPKRAYDFSLIVFVSGARLPSLLLSFYLPS
jgi:hypothetical protein